jgi:hypothetical protein
MELKIDIKNKIIFACDEVCMGSRIVDCRLRDYWSVDDNKIDQIAFDSLKDRRFDFEQREYGFVVDELITNYGNYQLDKITLDSFKIIPSDSISAFLKNHFESIFTSDEIDPLFKQRYITTVLKMVELFPGEDINNFRVFVLDVEKLESQNIKHEFVDWWEYFLTILIVYRGEKRGRFTYISFGFD